MSRRHGWNTCWPKVAPSDRDRFYGLMCKLMQCHQEEQFNELYQHIVDQFKHVSDGHI